MVGLEIVKAASPKEAMLKARFRLTETVCVTEVSAERRGTLRDEFVISYGLSAIESDKGEPAPSAPLRET